MGKIVVTGGRPLEGSVRIQGSKNAVLPMIAAGLLTEDKVILTNCPQIHDTDIMLELLRELGCLVSKKGHVIEIDSSTLNTHEIHQESAKSVRSSVMLLGSLLGRCKRARLPYPGGCVIGKRPINIHMEMLEKMGVSFKAGEGCFTAEAKELSGSCLQFYTKSVGAAENCILAAVLASGVTRLKGVSIEPEVMELCSMLRRMGAVILRTDYDELMIKGVKKLQGVTCEVPPDRIVAGTYMIAAAATRGSIRLLGAPVMQEQNLIGQLKKMGAEVYTEDDALVVDGSKAVRGIDFLRTDNYPGFPTDLQSQMAAALTMAESESVIEERIFEARFKAVAPLNKMGANIRIDGRRLYIKPVKKLMGTGVTAEELRGGAALVIAGLMAEGTTVIDGCRYIFRGYENIQKDLKSLGAAIELVDTGE